jgi:hypothetical protein
MIDGVLGSLVSPESLFAALGVFDKPDSESAPQRVAFDFASDLSHGTGLDNSNSLSLYPNPLLSTSSSLLPGETSSAPVTAVAGVPMLHAIFPFTDTSTVTSLIVELRFLTNSSEQPDYLMWLSDIF